MKKLFLLLLILPLAFVACSDDDDDTIVGTWTYSKETAKVTTKNDTDNVLAKAIEKAYYDEADDYDWSFTMKEDGTIEDPEGNKIGTYIVKGNVLTMIPIEEGEESEVYTYSFDGGNLVLSYDDTEDAEYEHERGYFDEYVEEGKTISEDATIEKVVALIYYTKK